MPLLSPLHTHTLDPLPSQVTPDGTLREDPPACIQYLFGRGTGGAEAERERGRERDKQRHPKRGGLPTMHATLVWKGNKEAE